jgi:hypothetical protein
MVRLDDAGSPHLYVRETRPKLWSAEAMIEDPTLSYHVRCRHTVTDALADD